jgi:hypothetical protein
MASFPDVINMTLILMQSGRKNQNNKIRDAARLSTVVYLKK